MLTAFWAHKYLLFVFAVKESCQVNTMCMGLQAFGEDGGKENVVLASVFDSITVGRTVQ